MLYTTYGGTGHEVSVIGFGGMRLDEQSASAPNYKEDRAALIRYAHAQGINYFDTAPWYCADQSEEITGMGLCGLPRDSFFVATKTNFGAVDRPATEKGFFTRLEQSLKRLQVDYIDFYHLWCLLSLSSYRKQCDTMYGWFVKAKEQGLIRHIVFSSHMPGDGLTAIIGEGLFEGVLLGYNALNYRFRKEGIASAAAQGMGVVVMNPMGGGIIPQNAEVFSYLNEGTPYTVGQAALRFVASHREVSVVLNGFASTAQVDEAVAATEGLKRVPLHEVIGALPESKAGFDSLCTSCGYCDSCPEGIPIPRYMDAYNQTLLGGNAAERLSYHWCIPVSYAKDCTGCGLCEQLCTQHLPIRERLKEIAKL